MAIKRSSEQSPETFLKLMLLSKPVLHIFAGPNGSGKSTIIWEFINTSSIGYYLNADDFEKSLREKKYISLGDFFVSANDELLQNHIKQSSLLQKALNDGHTINLTIKNNTIVSESHLANSYESALVLDFIRYLLLEQKARFSFETVMSHPSKKEILTSAIEKGYNCFLHFFCTESPLINIARVRDRIAKGGHPVDEDKIKSRYFNCLELLHELVPLTKKTDFYDNSKIHRMFASIEDGHHLIYQDADPIPKWFEKYVLGKLNLTQLPG